MSDFNNSGNNNPFGPKSFPTAIYPVHAKDTSGALKRSEPLITPDQLRSRYLKGVYMVFPNGDTFSNDDLKDQINIATNQAELLLKTMISPVEFEEKLDFDASKYKAFISLKTSNAPIISLERLAIISTNGQTLFEIPAPWIESAGFNRSEINVIPLLASFGTQSIAGSPIVGAGSPGNSVAFFSLWNCYGMLTNAPAYWTVTYKAGLSRTEGVVPVPVNELVGVLAAINLLSMLALLFLQTSVSLSQDGISQSSSNLGPRMYQLRIEELEKRRDNLVTEITALFGRRFFMSHI
jgi:hypothetical protein